MKNVIILVTDINYLKHIKYNINNIRENFNTADIVVITNDNDSIEVQKELEKYNIIIYTVNNKNNPFYIKYHIFDEYFKKWDKILYLDCDTMILRNADILFDLIDDQSKMLVDFEEWQVIKYFDSYCPRTQENEKEYISLLNEDYINSNGFNTGILLYKSSIISKEIINKIQEYHVKYERINKHVEKGTDQPIINLAFGNQCKQISNNYFSFWKRFNENSLILHFCRWEAPWFNETFNNKINQRYVDYYNNNKN